jgi:hypothetical protein
MNIDETAKYLRSLYVGLSFPQHYGEKQLDQLCKISASFGHNQTPQDLIESVPESPTLLSLWMLIGWAIDNVFDKFHKLTTNADVASLIKILDLDPSEAKLDENMAVMSNNSAGKCDPLVASLLESTQVLYNNAYVKGVQPYVNKTPEAWAMLKKWYSRYIAHVRDRQEFDTVADFMDFRLADVGIMCQYAQVMLFKGKVPAPEDEPIWCQATLAIAAINDIASFPRDMKQGTPNLLGVRMRQYKENAWNVMKWADEHSYELEYEVDHKGLTATDPYVTEVAKFSVTNAREWHMTHPRYAKGVQLLQARRTGKNAIFDGILYDDEPDAAQADPRSMEPEVQQ